MPKRRPPHRRVRAARPRAHAQEPAPPAGGPVTLAHIGPGQCRFVLGDPAGPATLFCGRPIERGWPWCAGHLVIVRAEGCADMSGTTWDGWRTM